MRDAGSASPTTASLHGALLDYFSAPGKYQLSLRQPATLFASMREILQIAAGRGPSAHADGSPPARLQEAAIFFVRTAMFHPGADHYGVLGLPTGADATDLKERYRLLMRLTHPDFATTGTNPWPPDAAMRVNRAYEVLSSPVLRREYDDRLAATGAQRVHVAPAPKQRPAARQLRPRPRPRPRAKATPAQPLRISRKTAWAFGAALTAAGLLILLPAREPEHLVQRARVPAAPATPERVATLLAPAPAPAPDPAAAIEQPAAAAEEPQPQPQPQAPAPPPQRLAAAQAAQAAQPAQPASPAPQPAAAPIAMATPHALPATPAVAPVIVTARAPVATPAPVAAPVHIAAPVAIPMPSPTLSDAQPLLTQLLQRLESGSGDEVLLLLERDARTAPGAQALSRQYEQLVRGARPVRLAQVEFKGEPHDGVLLVTGRVWLHAGEPTIGARGQRLLVRAEFASRGGKVRLTSLSGAPD